jgi:hypothetical protein
MSTKCIDTYLFSYLFWITSLLHLTWKSYGHGVDTENEQATGTLSLTQ